MFQKKRYKIFKDFPNVFGIVDDILVERYKADGKDHEDTLQKVVKTCRQVNLQLYKDKCHFRCTSAQFFGEIISRHGVRPDLQ